MTIDPARIARYLGLAEAATPGPWAQDDDCHVFSEPLAEARHAAIMRTLNDPSSTLEDQEQSALDPSICDCDQQRPDAGHDMDFIAAAHEGAELVRLLAAELEAVRTECIAAAKYVAESPCDPDITRDQIDAWRAYEPMYRARMLVDSAKGG